MQRCDIAGGILSAVFQQVVAAHAERLGQLGDNAWRAYNLKDVSAAMYKAERKEGLSLDARHEIFATALEGKEITFGEGEDESPALQM